MSTDPLVAKLVAIQDERRLSGDQMATLLKVSPATWSRLKSGETKRASRKVMDRALVVFSEVLGPYLHQLQISSMNGGEEQQKAEVA